MGPVAIRIEIDLTTLHICLQLHVHVVFFIGGGGGDRRI